MNKKELRKLPDIKITRTIMNKAKNEQGDKYYRLLLAEQFGEVLKVAVFFTEDILGGEKSPRFYIYADGKECETLDNRKNRWRTGSIEYLDCERHWEYWPKVNYSTKATDDLVKCFLGTSKEKAYSSIVEYQNNLKAEQKKLKFRREQEEIQEVMQIVPKKPKDFDKWMEDNAIPESRYIYYTYPSNQGYCTHCKKEVAITGQKHNKRGTCPNCRSTVIYKAVKKAAVVHDEGVGFLLNRHNDGFVLRAFVICKSYEDYKQPRVRISEIQREILYPWMSKEQAYSSEGYGESGAPLWKKGEYVQNKYWWAWTPRDGRLYYKNLDQVLDESKLKYIPMKEMIKNNKQRNTYPSRMLSAMAEFPMMEYFVKMKMYKFIYEFIEDGSFGNSSYSSDIVDRNAKKPWDALGITKSDFKKFVEMDGGIKELRVLKRTSLHNVDMTIEQIKEFVERGYDLAVISEMNLATPHKVLRYLRENEEIENVSVLYKDYLNMMREQGYTFERESEVFPRELVRKHDELVELRNKEKNKNRIKEALRDYPEIKERFRVYSSIYQFEANGYVICVPRDAADIVREGQVLHHCVGGNNYLSKHSRGESVILFLRKKDHPKKRYYTLEVQGQEVRQAYGAHDKKPNWEEVSEVIEEFKRNVLLRTERRAV